MSGHVPNLICYGGEIVKLAVRKRKGETHAERAGRVAAMAITQRVKHYAIRWDRTWKIFPVSGPITMPIHDGLTEAQAAMWLLYRADTF